RCWFGWFSFLEDFELEQGIFSSHIEGSFFSKSAKRKNNLRFWKEFELIAVSSDFFDEVSIFLEGNLGIKAMKLIESMLFNAQAGSKCSRSIKVGGNCKAKVHNVGNSLVGWIM